MKIALMPGHASVKEGACLCAGEYKGTGEHALARLYLHELGEYLENKNFEVAHTCREAAGGTTPSYSAKAANATGADVALEWHFNSCDNPSVRGCEVLYWGNSARGRKVAVALSRELAKLLNVPNRGAKPVYGPQDRGYHAFRRSAMPFFMIEPCFGGSNEEDACAFGEAISAGSWQAEAAGVVARVLEEFYGNN